MAAPRASRGLSKVQVPVYIGAGIDTKNNPKLVQPGSLLELENMYQLRTGELRLRNGFAALSALDYFFGNPRTSDNIFPMPGGVLGSVGSGNMSATIPAKGLQKYTVPGGWIASENEPIFATYPYPLATATVTGLAGETTFSVLGGSVPDLVDGSTATLPSAGRVTSGIQLTSWLETATGNLSYSLRSTAAGTLIGSMAAANGSIVGNGRPGICCNAGTAAMCFFYCDNAGTPSLQVRNFDLLGSGQSGAATLVLNGVSAAQPWIDAKPIPGGNLIAVAYRSSAGGVSCLVYDASTSTVTVGPVNTAGADASFCLGWLDDTLNTGNLYLATAGSTSGVVVRTMSPTTLVVSATKTIDATATANVRQVTGHIDANATTFSVLWEVSAAPTYFSTVKVGVNVAGTVTVPAYGLAPGFCLYSRTFRGTDGLYCWIGAYDSTVQPSYFVMGMGGYKTGSTTTLLGQIFPTYAGGRRVFQSCLANAAQGSKGICVPLSRKQFLTNNGTTVTGLRLMTNAEIVTSSAQLRRPRELGGTLFLPGGILQRDDGRAVEHAIMPIFQEQPTLVSSATGSMTGGGAYSYRLVLRRVDANGRITRSAGSAVMPITLGAGDGRVTITAQNPRGLNANFDSYTLEVFRAGPAATGAVNYNKVGEIVTTFGNATTTLTFVDTMSDANALLGELAYFTGNVLEHFAPPGCTLLEVNGNRVWIVSAEDPTQLWYSKEYKPGAGIGFNPALTMRVTGDGYGGITALAAMDGRLIAFKSQAIYVISGDGPNDLGQGTFNPPQAVSLSVGTVLPGSVLAMPEGIMFQGAAGIYLLDRGLGLTYLGKAVEQYTLAESCVDASLVQGVNHVRFVMPSGRCLVWDYDLKVWSTYKLRVDGSTVVACANVPSGWCYALANGTVYQETPGIYTDINAALGTSLAIVPRVGFPHLNLAGLAGYQRIYAIEALFDVIGDHTVSLDCEFDYSGAVTGTARTKAVTAGAASAIVEYNPPSGHAKSTSIRPVLTTSVQAAGSGAFRLTGLAIIVGVKRGSNTPYTSRLT